MRKPVFCICTNKGADQLRSNRTADQSLCLHYIDSTINPKFKASSHLLWLYSWVCVEPGRKPLLKAGFLMTQLNIIIVVVLVIVRDFITQ